MKMLCYFATAAAIAGCSSSDTQPTPDSGADTGTGTDAIADVSTADADASAPLQWMAMVRGTLAVGDAGDLSQAKATHDAIAKGGEASSKTAGDIAHAVLLGTNILDGVPNEFLAMDRWTDSTAMQAFYANPQVQQSFGSLFTTPPTITFFVLAPDWVNWGDMHSGDTFNPHFVHLALGTLASADNGQNEAAHNQVASGGKDPSMQAGNVAHVVWLGLSDPRQFNGVDIWSSDTNIQAFYTNPQFVAAFAPLFSSVTQPVFQSTDWYQW